MTPDDPTALREALARVGHRVPRNVYFRSEPLFVAASEALAAEVVEAINAGGHALAERDALQAQVARMGEALKLCLGELDWQTTATDRCGDPGCECPLQDFDAPTDGHRLAREAARAALQQQEVAHGH